MKVQQSTENERDSDLTILQEHVMNKSSPHHKERSYECELIRDMLTFDHRRRPSCRDIIDCINTTCKNKRLRRLARSDISSTNQAPATSSLYKTRVNEGRVEATNVPVTYREREFVQPSVAGASYTSALLLSADTSGSPSAAACVPVMDFSSSAASDVPKMSVLLSSGKD